MEASGDSVSASSLGTAGSSLTAESYKPPSRLTDNVDTISLPEGTMKAPYNANIISLLAAVPHSRVCLVV